MDEAKKRMFFTADEKIFIKELVHNSIDIVENKRSDVGSVATKKRKWKEIADEFNLNSQFSKRTAEQIKKCWENMKSKRKVELAQEKRQRMTTGGGPFPGSSTQDDPLIDPTNVNIEITDAIDSDTLSLVTNRDGGSLYSMNEDGILQRISTQEELNNPEQTRDEGQTPVECEEAPSEQTPRGKDVRKMAAIVREADKRMERYGLLSEQSRELHDLKLKELKFKLMAAEQEYIERKYKALTAEFEYHQRVKESAEAHKKTQQVLGEIACSKENVM